jgi:hypothetical protein
MFKVSSPPSTFTETPMPKISKREMATAVAKDVIAQLNRRTKGYEATPGLYVYIECVIPTNVTDLQDAIPSIENQVGKCNVCALGAAVLSKARLFDNVPIDGEAASYGGVISLDYDDCFNGLKDIFSESQLQLIEAAFEGWDEGSWETNPAIRRAVAFGEKYIDDDKKRMKAIMQNIIDNDGTFKPPAVPKVTRSSSVYDWEL